MQMHKVNITQKLKSVGLGMDLNCCKLEPHNALWENAFLELKNEMYFHLNKYWHANEVVINHIGSTALPIMAKPILDIAIFGNGVPVDEATEILTKKMKLRDDCIPKLYDKKGLCYAYFHFFKNGYITKGFQNGMLYADKLLFLKYLKENPESMKEYENIKKGIILSFGKIDAYSYPCYKSKFVEDTLKAAHEKYSQDQIDEMCGCHIWGQG
jgi:GrpB-like predicted nucleotidyltransferase (UPF0157 family)